MKLLQPRGRFNIMKWSIFKKQPREFDKGILRDAGNENIRVDVDDHRLNMATQPTYFRESQSSQAHLNNIDSQGETQIVHGNQVELDDSKPPFAGATQPVNGHEGFDDMVILQNNTLTASGIPPTNAGHNFSQELIHCTDVQPLQDTFVVSAFTPNINISSNGIAASYHTNPLTGERETHAVAEGLNKGVSVAEVHEHTEVHPSETAGQLGVTEGKEEKDTNTSEPQVCLLSENVNRKGKADEGKMCKDGEAEIGVKDDVTGKAKVVSDQDIQAIKGRKVVKKFGRKNFTGQVVDYDSENQWFKVVYEDGDEEDLELLEVKEILFTAETSSNASTAKRKPKGTPKEKRAVAGAQKKSWQIKSSPGSKTKGLKRSGKFKSSRASAYESPSQFQPRRGGKRKRSPDVETMKEKNRRKKQSGNAKKPRSCSTKRGRGKAMPEKNSSREKGSLSKLPLVDSKVEKGGDTGGKPVVKRRRKIDTHEDDDTIVGKAVQKDFGGVLYIGVVAKFDKTTKYYKVKYEDGDQEDLELEELKAVLVQ